MDKINTNENCVWIIDFGSQYTQLITKKSRELGYASFVYTFDEAISMLKKGLSPKSIILSGGPASVFEDKNDYSLIFDQKLPLLGICYGMQLIGQYYGGKVSRGVRGEYGESEVKLSEGVTFKGISSQIFKVWMSHFDHLESVPDGFSITLKSKNDMIAGIENKSQKIMGLQFHPEVKHTEYGAEVLKHFFEDIAGLEKSWSSTIMLKECQQDIEHTLGLLDTSNTEVTSASQERSKVLCAFSGGVDSLVAATLAQKCLGDNLYCFFVDNGLLRPQDYHHIEVLKKETNLNIESIDAKDLFLANLKGVSGPEEKRKIIGKTFIEVFEAKVHEFEKDHNIKFSYLLQGTLYPDVIESLSPHKKGGKSVTIKSHHNVGGLPERMHLKLLEPLRSLFKDDVRALGEELGLKKEWIYRHPFPGPGIGVRVLGELSEKSIKKVQSSDQILFEELKRTGNYDNCWQAFTVLLPVKTVGVKGDARAYEEVICLRIVDSSDGMTATWSRLDMKFLAYVSARITNEVAGVTRVVYDITSKPPGTIEWE